MIAEIKIKTTVRRNSMNHYIIINSRNFLISEHSKNSIVKKYKLQVKKHSKKKYVETFVYW